MRQREWSFSANVSHYGEAHSGSVATPRECGPRFARMMLLSGLPRFGRCQDTRLGSSWPRAIAGAIRGRFERHRPGDDFFTPCRHCGWAIAWRIGCRS